MGRSNRLNRIVAVCLSLSIVWALSDAAFASSPKAVTLVSQESFYEQALSERLINFPGTRIAVLPVTAYYFRLFGAALVASVAYANEPERLSHHDASSVIGLFGAAIIVGGWMLGHLVTGAKAAARKTVRAIGALTTRTPQEFYDPLIRLAPESALNAPSGQQHAVGLGAVIEQWNRSLTPAIQRLPYLLHIAADVLSTLEAEHFNNAVHDDIRPATIYLTPTHAVLTSDRKTTKPFGSEVSLRLGYVPRRKLNDPSHELSSAAHDIYALGMTLVRALPGVDDVDGILRFGHIYGKPLVVHRYLYMQPEAVRQFVLVILKATLTDQRKRYQTVNDMRAAVFVVQQHLPVGVRITSSLLSHPAVNGTANLGAAA